MENTVYKRKISSWERMLYGSPYSVVSMVIRIRGNVTEEILRQAIIKVQQRHTLLRVRIDLDEQEIPWFTSDDVGEIPIEVHPREKDDSWLGIYDIACAQPFDFDKRPAIRFYLVKSEALSDIMIFCHHVICDGMSLVYLARDLMIHMGNSDKKVEILGNPLPISRKTIPKDLKLSGFMRKIIEKINSKWMQEKESFDHADYIEIHRAYWKNFTHKTISLEFSEEETERIVSNCRKNNISVTSGISIAFVGAQRIVQGKKPFHSKIGVAGDLRNRLVPKVGDAMGFYASLVRTDFKYNPKKSMWDNARSFHKKISKLYVDKKLLDEPLTFNALDPSIMESRFYKVLGNLIPSDSPRYEKIFSFSRRNDTLLALLKRSKMESIENVIMGTAITNLTRMEFPQKYGNLELDRLIMQPGGGFPLVTVNLVIGVVTSLNKMSLLLEYAEEQIDTEIVEKTRDIALEFLLSK